MRHIASQYTTSIHNMTLLFLLIVFIADGCSKESSSTGPNVPNGSPTIPSVNGRWVGGGIHIIGGTYYNFSMTADFVQAYVQAWDSKFVGSMSTTWPAISQTNIMYCRGTVTTARKVTLVDTGGVAMFGGRTVPAETGIYSNRTNVVLSANGDTMSYSGSFGLGTENFVLVRQK